MARPRTWHGLTAGERAAAIAQLRRVSRSMSGQALEPLPMTKSRARAIGRSLGLLADTLDPPAPAAASKRRLHNWYRSSRLGAKNPVYACRYCGTRNSYRVGPKGGIAQVYLLPGANPKKPSSWTQTRPNCTGRRKVGAK